MFFGYARVSTNGQARDGNSMEFQINALKKAGAEKIFSDIFSGSKNDRPELDKLIKIIQAGDTLIITKLDRIARSLIQGIQLIENLINKGISATPSELTELGRFYFRESDQKVSGEINYSIGGTPKKATFATPTANGFTRNHTWIVYGYFVSSGNLLLNIVEIKDWINIVTSEEIYNW